MHYYFEVLHETVVQMQQYCIILCMTIQLLHRARRLKFQITPIISHAMFTYGTSRLHIYEIGITIFIFVYFSRFCNVFKFKWVNFLVN